MKRGLLVLLLAACGSQASEASHEAPSASGGSAFNGGAAGEHAGASSSGGSPSTFGGTTFGGASIGTGGAPLPPSSWRDSREPFCAPKNAELGMRALWSDERGVFILLASGANEAGAGAIHFNGGDGWTEQTTLTNSVAAPSLTGFMNGKLVEYGSAPCGIQFIDGMQEECSAAAPSISSLHIVDVTLGYAVYSNRVLRFDGTYWTQYGAPLTGDGMLWARSVWASDAHLLVAADPGVYLQLPSSMTLEPQPGLPVSSYGAAWGVSPQELWVGNEDGQLWNFDGEKWSLEWTVDSDCPSIRGIWGIEGALFIHTDREIFIREYGMIRRLHAATCDDPTIVRGMWGNHKNEVFFALQGTALSGLPCGGAQLLWFDGAELGPL